MVIQQSIHGGWGKFIDGTSGAALLTGFNT